MRLTPWYLKMRARLPQDENKVPFKQVTPLRLKNRVAGQGKVDREEGCLYEMSLLLSCLQEKDFQNKLCGPELDQFNKCYKKHRAIVDAKKKGHEQIIPVPNSTLSTRQITYLLRKYPIT